jgi:hypothetical protein
MPALLMPKSGQNKRKEEAMDESKLTAELVEILGEVCDNTHTIGAAALVLRKLTGMVKAQNAEKARTFPEWGVKGAYDA